MGFLNDLFRHKTPEEKAEAEFLKWEKDAWKEPGRSWRVTFNVYLGGSMSSDEGIIQLPQYKNPDKAVELMRAALDPANLANLEKRMGDKLDDSFLYHFKPAMAMLSPDAEEQRKYMREVCLCSKYQMDNLVAWYAYSHGLIDKYFSGVEEQAMVYYELLHYSKNGDNPLITSKEALNYGWTAWKWEMYECKTDEERYAIVTEDLKKRLSSDDPKVAEKTRELMDAVKKLRAQKLGAAAAALLDIYEYEQDILDVQLVDEKTGRRVEVHDRKISYKD